MKNIIVFSFVVALLNSSCSIQSASSLERVAQGFNAYVQNNLSHQESQAIEAIEFRRKTLSTDQTPLGSHTVAHSAGKSSMSFSWGNILFHLVKSWQPEIILEIGTCIGISSAYVDAALHANNKGELISLERCDALVPFVNQNWKVLGVKHAQVRGGDITQLLNEVIDERHIIDMVFDDENHHEQPTLDKFEQLLPHLVLPTLYVFDDIQWSDGMKRAWNRIKQHKHVAVSIALGNPSLRFGVCIIDPTIKEKQDITIKLDKAQYVDVKDGKLVVRY